MKTLTEQIKEFHIACDEVMPQVPTMLEVDPEAVYIAKDIELMSQGIKRYTANESDNLLLKRVSWMLEEIAELLRADSIEGQVDALVDLTVFTKGTYTYMGLTPEPFEDIVMQANMGKVGENGKVLKNEQGKIIKPDGWHEQYAPEPKIAAEIERQRVEADRLILLPEDLSF
ncbi:MAG: HAD family hydrolase [Candidatus Pristimantibacillus lignocellulolyticus]|uniref:HAD family hydrolase n=1 Tax=Candidatus Pristimantibacillus lignocellulolyticus TaxID=2994561 RepID=A0A9J6ZEM8_9BACL|nr:MAG: HAD family hydrolase [Candidatus Pristimantibacillus lignocellulolyticus]